MGRLYSSSQQLDVGQNSFQQPRLDNEILSQFISLHSLFSLKGGKGKGSSNFKTKQACGWLELGLKLTSTQIENGKTMINYYGSLKKKMIF